MYQVLILDDRENEAESLKRIVDDFKDDEVITSDIVTTLSDARKLVEEASRAGRPYSVLLIDQVLGPGKDGISAMQELESIDRSASTIILTGFDSDPGVGIRAYRAGAFRYLSKLDVHDELEFVFKSLTRSKREEVEKKWRNVFNKMMEAALQHSDFTDVARVVVNSSIKLGFKSSRLFWAPQKDINCQSNRFVGIHCVAKECDPVSFQRREFDLSQKKRLKMVLQLRKSLFFHVTEKNKELKKDIESLGLTYPPGGWWILPLWGGDDLLGMLILDFGKKQTLLTTHEDILLNFFTRQVAIILQHARLYGKEKHVVAEMKFLQRASLEMLQIANHTEEVFWLTVLTMITADFGLGFNRAILFLAKNSGKFLYGAAGIGHNDKPSAKTAWERDKSRAYDMDSFLTDAMEGKIARTPLHDFILGKEMLVSELGEDIQGVLAGEKRRRLSKDEMEVQLPAVIQKGYVPTDCELLPVSIGSAVIGLLIVDNMHNDECLDTSSIGNLQSLMANASLVWEILRQRKQSDNLLSVNYEILGGASYHSLQETLNLICKSARSFCGANWAVIYPIKKSKGSYELEYEKFGHDGNLKEPVFDRKGKFDADGISMHILQHGELVVEDIKNAALPVADISQDNFIKREGVTAFMGISIKKPHTREPLGILYLDYLEPHIFSPGDIKHAESFARLAAIAISNERRNDEQRQRELLGTAKDISDTMGTELNIDVIMEKVLEKLKILFQNTALCVLLYDTDKEVLQFAPNTLKYYEITNPAYQSVRVFPVKDKKKRSVAAKCALEALERNKQATIEVRDVETISYYLPLNLKTTSELCVSLMSGEGDLLGVLTLEREDGFQFNKDDIALVQTVAHQLGQAIDRSRQSELLAFKSQVASLTAWASDIAHDINTELFHIRGNAYLIKQSSQEEEIIEYVNTIDEHAENLANVGKWSLQSKKKIKLESSLLSLLTKMVEPIGIFLDTDFKTPDVYIEVNPNELRRVLRHLVRNAARAMQYLKEKKIQISTKRLKGDKVEILFQDFGTGIEDDVRNALFRRKVSTKPTEDEEGGYGLLLVRQLVDDMGGKISPLPTELGKGAIFSILLPIAELSNEVENEGKYDT